MARGVIEILSFDARSHVITRDRKFSTYEKYHTMYDPYSPQEGAQERGADTKHRFRFVLTFV